MFALNMNILLVHIQKYKAGVNKEKSASYGGLKFTSCIPTLNLCRLLNIYHIYQKTN